MARLALVTPTGQFSESVTPLDIGALVAPYRPYSAGWLIRLRRGEIDTRPPERLRR